MPYAIKSTVKILLMALSAYAMAQESCTLPEQIPKPNLLGVDCKKIMSPDYYALSLSWSPQHCAGVNRKSPKHALQCSLNSFDFVVHGLWGQNSKAKGMCDHPRNCSKSLVSDATIQKTLCTVPSVDLIQGEWQKHGTCTGWSEDQYFEKTRALWAALVKPDITQLLNQDNETTAGAVTQAFVQANQDSGLFADAVAVQVASKNKFKEVFVCYDLKFKYKACKTGKTPANQTIKVLRPQGR